MADKSINLEFTSNAAKVAEDLRAARDAAQQMSAAAEDASRRAIAAGDRQSAARAEYQARERYMAGPQVAAMPAWASEHQLPAWLQAAPAAATEPAFDTRAPQADTSAAAAYQREWEEKHAREMSSLNKARAEREASEEAASVARGPQGFVGPMPREKSEVEKAIEAKEKRNEVKAGVDAHFRGEFVGPMPQSKAAKEEERAEARKAKEEAREQAKTEREAAKAQARADKGAERAAARTEREADSKMGGSYSREAREKARTEKEADRRMGSSYGKVDRETSAAAKEKARAAASAAKARAKDGLGNRLQSGMSNATRLVGSGGLSGVTAMGGPAAAGAAALVLVNLGANAAARSLDVLGNSTLNAGQKAEKFSEAMPIVGGLVKSLRELDDVIHGVTEGARRNQLRLAEHGALRGARISIAAQTDSLRMDVAQATHRHEAIAGLAMPVQGPTARSTLGERREYEEFQRLEPLRQNVRKTQALADAARKAHSTSGIDALVSDTGMAEERARQADRRARDTGAALKARSPAIQAAGMGMGLSWSTSANAARADHKRRTQASNTDEVIAAKNLTDASDRHTEALKKQREIKESMASLDSQARQAQIALTKETAAMWQAREQRATGQAQSLGAMSDMDFEMGRHSREMFYKHGRQAMTSEMYSRFANFDPEGARAAAEKPGEARRALLREDDRKAGRLKDSAFRDTLAESREKRDKYEMEAKIDLHIDEVKLAEAFKTIMEGFFKRMEVRLEAKQKNAEREHKTGVQEGQGTK